MKKKILAFLLAVSLVSGTVISPVGITVVNAEETMENTVNFECIVLEDGTLEITGLTETEGVTELVIPSEIDGKAVTSIGEWAFSDCDFISVDIADTITEIKSYAFGWCGSLKNVMIPASVKNIGVYAFTSSRGLESLTISNAEITIANGVFYNCDALRDVYYNGTQVQWNTVDMGYENQALNYATVHCTDVTIEPDEFKYDITDDSKCVIMGLTKPEGVTEITIPSEINGSIVTGIGEDAFCELSSLESVTIPDTVTSIADGAFVNCGSLENIAFSNTITEIGANAFSGTKWIENKRAENPLVIVNSILIDGTTAQGAVTIPDTVTTIGYDAFKDCTELTGITIPDTVTGYILGGAFEGCTGLKNVVIPESVTGIGYSVFQDCSHLESIEIPESVTGIGSMAFYNCSSLKSIELPSKLEGFNRWTFSGCTSLTSLKIPDSITGIGWYTFSGCSGLTSVELPKSITYIGTGAFSYCDNIKDVYYGGSEKRWNNEVGISWEDSTSGASSNDILKTATIHYAEENEIDFTYQILEDDEEYWVEVLRITGCDNEKAEELVIPSEIKGNKVTSIGFHAFESYENLVSVTIPDTVTFIGDGAFANCEKLVNISIPESVIDIGTGAFEGTAWLADRQVENALVSVNGILLDGKIAEGTVAIPEGIARIRAKAFAEGKLTSVTIPDTVKYIGRNAFEDCQNLKNATIPATLKSIGYYAFENCDNLTDIYYDGTSQQWYALLAGEYDGDLDESEGSPYLNLKKANVHCADGTIEPSIFDYEVADYDNTITIRGLIDADGVTEIVIPSEINGREVSSISKNAFSGYSTLKNIIIPSTITSIGRNAFAGTKWLANKQAENPLVIINGILIDATGASGEIVIPDTVTSIIDYAFSDCSGLTGVIWSKTMETIGYGMFSNCSNLTNITIPEGVTYIEEEAFSGCSSLTSITIPEGVTSIEYGVFSDCSNLETINIPNSVTSINKNAFTGTKWLEAQETIDGFNIANGVLLSADIEEIYEAQTGSMIKIPDTVTRIANHVFNDSDGGFIARELILPENLISIGIYAFADCPIGSVNIPAGVTQVAEGAFSGCESLTSVTISEGVKSIGWGAFSDCFKLNDVKIPESVDDIGGCAFEGTQWLSQQRELHPLVIVNNMLLDGMMAVGDIEIPNTVTKICENAFSESVLTNIYYDGTKEQWQKISIESGNDALANATIHYADVLTPDKENGNEQIVPTPDAGNKDDQIIQNQNNNNQTPVALGKVSLSKSETVYTGKTQAPVITVTDANGQPVDAVNYTAIYTNNKNVGQATVTVTGKNNYTGTLIATFKILPKSTKISKLAAKKKSFTVKWKKQTKQTTGYEIQYSTSKKFKGAKKVTVKKAKTTSTTIKKLKAKKKYYVRIRTYKIVKINGKSTKMYSSWSNAKAIKVK
ncbi:MAG: leucine-rich repeat domain-containing protein [Lachnospiraceae bacterium]|nr:leucine-rich repeat domain-containing protein [Lachnospiraceae bacterium]